MKVLVEATSEFALVDGRKTRIWRGFDLAGAPVVLFSILVVHQSETTPEVLAGFESAMPELTTEQGLPVDLDAPPPTLQVEFKEAPCPPPAERFVTPN
jgi:hypothetical protein